MNLNQTLRECNLDGKNSEAIISKAAGLFEKGDLAGATTLLREAVSKSPHNSVLLVALASAYRAQGEFDKALSTAGSALAAGSNNPEALAIAAFCHIDKKQFQKALPLLEQAIAINPYEAKYFQKLGIVHQRLKSYAGAARVYEKAIELDPTNASSYSNLGQVLFELQEYGRSIELLEKAIELKPTMAEYRVLLARVKGVVDKDKGVETDLEAAVELKEDFPVAQRMLGFRYLELGRFDAAEEHFRKSLELSPKQGRVYEGIVATRKMTLDDEPLAKSMEALLDDFSVPYAEKRHLLYALGKYHNDVKQFEEAFRSFDAGNAMMKERLPKPFNRKMFTYIVNGFMETFNRDYFASHRSLGSESARPILVVGMIRSGTTLLEEILSRHPKIGAGGELLYWATLVSQTRDQAMGVITEEQAAKWQKGYLNALEEAAPGFQLIVDKMPQNFLLMGWIHTMFPNAKVLLCKRKPIDNCLSIWMTPFREALEFAHDKRNIVYYYREFERMAAYWQANLPEGSIREVQYENVVDDAEGEIRQTLEFLGLDWDPACIETRTEERVIDTPSMWQARQKIYRTSVDRWKNYEPWLGEFRELLD